jgi:integrase
MAHIVKRNNSYAVVHSYKSEEGKRVQKWETYHSEKEAYERKLELDNPNLFLGVKPRVQKLNQLLDQYIELHGQLRWSVSTYTGCVSLMCNYIRPHIGEILIAQINRNLISRYFQRLQTTPRVTNKYKPNDIGFIGFSTLQEINKLLHSVFQQAIYWGYMEVNPVDHIKLHHAKPNYKHMLNIEQVLEVVNSAIYQKKWQLALAIQLAFVCSMRKGEIYGLQWENIDLDNRCIFVDKEMSRASLKTLRVLNYRGVHHVFPPHSLNSQSRLVLKDPKTASSIRTIYLPPTMVDNLKMWKQYQVTRRSSSDLGYQNNDLVFCKENGSPHSFKRLSDEFEKLLVGVGAPKIYFHSLRYSSTSYKLILSRGDIKAVQGDNGHAQPDMVLSIYALIQSEQRIKLANKVEADFCLHVISPGSKR